MNVEIFNKLNNIASIDGRQYIVVKNNIIDDELIFIVEQWKPCNKNINPYNDLLGKNITEYISKDYFRFLDNGNFNIVKWKQETSLIKSESIQFPDHWNWITIKKNI